MIRRPKILFICGKNKRRSPTAEKIFKSDQRMFVRSAGTSETSQRRLTEGDLKWADLILVMQRKYASQIRVKYGHLDLQAPVHSLEITDDYTFMNPKLIQLLRDAVDYELELFAEAQTPPQD